MLEEAIPSLWTSMHGWFTPAVLFLLLNVVIGTIAVTSTSVRSPNPHPNSADDLPRSPSAAVLQRIRSFSFRHGADPPVPPPPEADPAPEQQQQQHFSRSRSDAQPTAGESTPKLASRMSKSASDASAFAHFGAADVVQVEEEEEEMEVDARADDFINRFKQQLKMQRLDSLVRYKEMLRRSQ